MPALSGRECAGTPQSGCSYNASIKVAPQADACPLVRTGVFCLHKQEKRESFKNELADLLVRKLTCIQENYYKVIAEGFIGDLLDKGLKYAEAIAKMKYEEVRSKIGLGR